MAAMVPLPELRKPQRPGSAKRRESLLLRSEGSRRAAWRIGELTTTAKQLDAEQKGNRARKEVRRNRAGAGI